MIVFLYMAALFVALSPGVLARFPKNCSKLVVAATHGLAFVAIFCLTYKFVMRLGRRMGYEGFQDPPMPTAPMPPPAPTQQRPPPSGPMPMPAQPVQSPSGSSNLAAMNVMISTGSGKSGNVCMNGNDCASGMCMASKCM